MQQCPNLAPGLAVPAAPKEPILPTFLQGLLSQGLMSVQCKGNEVQAVQWHLGPVSAQGTADLLSRHTLCIGVISADLD